MRAIETMGDLEACLLEIGLPISIRYNGFSSKEWEAKIEWSYQDYTTATAIGRAPTMLAAVVNCLAAYERRNA
jgi:hypothetical protein